MMEQLGYPNRRWKRPALWTTCLVVLVAEQSWAIADAAWPSRLISLVGLLVIGDYTTTSWRKHRAPSVEPMGRVEYPAR